MRDVAPAEPLYSLDECLALDAATDDARASLTLDEGCARKGR